MQKKIRKLIHVTQEDIDNGQRMKTTKCAVALALQRDLNDPTAYVTNSYALFDDCWQDYPLSKRTIEFIHQFDAEKPIKPFNFYIMIRPKQEM